MIKAVAFDFDGTIADSFEALIRTAEVILKWPRSLTSREIDELRDCSIPEVMRKLRVKKWQLPLLVLKGHREIDKHMDGVKAFEGMVEAIKELSAEGYKLYIVSSHSEKGVKELLDKYQLTEHMSRIYGGITLWGKAKGLKRLQKQEGFSANECIFVGDEIRDIEAAAKAQTHCIAVAWGFNKPGALKLHNPDAVVRTPKELVGVVRRLSL